MASRPRRVAQFLPLSLAYALALHESAPAAIDAAGNTTRSAASLVHTVSGTDAIRTSVSDQPTSSADVIVMVTNKDYFKRVIETASQLRDPNLGAWNGDILLIHGSDMDASHVKELEPLKIRTRRFPDLTQWKQQLPENLPRKNKWFQYMKMWIFDSYMLHWNRVLYMDSGMNIQNSM